MTTCKDILQRYGSTFQNFCNVAEIFVLISAIFEWVLKGGKSIIIQYINLKRNETGCNLQIELLSKYAENVP